MKRPPEYTKHEYITYENFVDDDFLRELEELISPIEELLEKPKDPGNFSESFSDGDDSANLTQPFSDGDDSANLTASLEPTDNIEIIKSDQKSEEKKSVYQNLQTYKQDLELIQKDLTSSNLNDICDLYNQIVAIYENLNDYENILVYALKFLDHIKSVAENPKYAEDHVNITHLKAINIVASAYYACENYEESIKYRKITAKLYPKLLDNYTDSNSYATYLDNMGETYGRLGNHVKSFNLQHKALDIRKKLLKEQNNLVNISIKNYNDMLVNSCGEEETLEPQKEALKTHRELSKNLDILVATSLNNLGNAAQNLLEYDEALEYQKEALSKFDNLLGENNNQSAIVIGNIARTFCKKGDYEEALKYHEKSLSIKKNNFGDNHLETALDFVDIGSTYCAYEKHDESLEYYKKALDVFESLEGSYNTHIITTLFNIALECCLLENHKDEILYLKQYLDEYNSFLENNTHMVMQSKYNSFYEILKKLSCSENDGDNSSSKYTRLDEYDCIMDRDEIISLFGNQASEADLSIDPSNTISLFGNQAPEAYFL